jgi:hypothetical protein
LQQVCDEEYSEVLAVAEQVGCVFEEYIMAHSLDLQLRAEETRHTCEAPACMSHDRTHCIDSLH